MATLKSDFLRIIRERGFLHQCTDLEGLDALFTAGKPVTAYIGFDCTAPSLHVGSLMQIMILRWLQNFGHRPIVLMGGGTTKIGDPSGKDEARKLLDDAQINANMAGIKENFKRFISFEEKGGNALMVNNDDWLKNLNLVEFLRDYGRFFSVNRMLDMDSVRLRLEREQNLSFLEFNYMILQAYDFVELNKQYDCTLQIGGSDQWGNIVNGVELKRRVKPKYRSIRLDEDIISSDLIGGGSHAQNNVFGLTTPLITTSSGAKMGKTAGGAVWLNADRLPAFDYWQFWRNTEDADVGRFLRFFTELPMDEIHRLESLQGAEINEAKKTLADEATRLCHGNAAAKLAAETARKTFEEGGAGGALPELIVRTGEALTVRDALTRLHFAESGGDAKKLIQGGGVKLNDKPVSDINAKISDADFMDGAAKLSKGKKHHAIVRLMD